MEKGLKHYGISGGGFKIPGLAGATVEVLHSNYNPDIISGVSSGAILTFVSCASDYPIEAIANNATTFSKSDVFSHSPWNDKHKLTLRSIYNAIFKSYLAKQDKLGDLLRRLVSEEEFNDYLTNDDKPIGIVMSVDYLKGTKEYYNLKELDYNSAIDIVISSCSIPVFVNPIHYDGKLLYDGGVRNHILTESIIDQFNISSTISTFSRAEDFSRSLELEDLDSTVKVLLRTIEILENETSNADQELAKVKAQSKGINYIAIHIPNILDNVYDDNSEKQKELYELGRTLAIKELKKLDNYAVKGYTT